MTYRRSISPYICNGRYLEQECFAQKQFYSKVTAFLFNIEPRLSCLIRRASPPPRILDPLDEEPSLAGVLTLEELTGVLEVPTGEGELRT